LYLIVARGGSKTVKNKNLRRLAGISLVGYKAIAAQKSHYCERLMISTDSEAIQQEARRYDVEVPFKRPAELATDDAAVVDVIKQLMDWSELECRESFDAIMLLEPSSPFATGLDLDRAVETMISKNANAVVGVRAMEVNSTFVGPLDSEGRMLAIIDKIGARRELGRQNMEQEYTMNGCLYLFGWDFFRQHGAIYSDREGTYGLVMDRYYSIEIDEPIDLAWAEFLIEKGYVDLSYWR
jgi:CMP-N,N'-diacetyllegionaminic acid synthase